MEFSEEQRNVLDSKAHRLMISGCAGAGKTTLIREMIQQNIRQGYSPEDILFVSFGRKDADIFSDKLDEVNLGGVLSATCHGFCYRICTEDARKKKLKKWLSEQGMLNLVQGQGEFMNFMNGLDHVLKQDVVELTTIHQSKGKEYPCVVGVLSDKMMADRREEQRIRYVAATRPSEQLVETIV